MLGEVDGGLDPGTPVAGPTLDELALGLQRLRLEAGGPSYAEIATRVSRLRQTQGASEAEARVGRTTVYDIFRTGRRRINRDLVVDVVRSLGVDEQEALDWGERCRTAQQPAVVATIPTPVEPPPAEPPPAEPPPVEPAPVASSTPHRFVVVVLAACLVVNLVGRLMVDVLGLPVYLDMAGTAVVAFLLGPWWGVLVAVLTNVLGVTISGPASLAFMVVNVAGALMWGYGARRLPIGRSVPRFLALNVVVAVGCTAIAAPVLVLFFGGDVQHGTDTITGNILVFTHNLAIATFSANLLSSLANKVISGFLALAVLDALVPHSSEVRRRTPF